MPDCSTTRAPAGKVRNTAAAAAMPDGKSRVAAAPSSWRNTSSAAATVSLWSRP